MLIEIDGGVNDKNAHLLKEAGADILVAGSYVFKSNDYVAQMNYIISSMEELSGTGKIKIITDEYEEIKSFENLEECIDKNIRFIISGMPITQKMVDMFYEKTTTPVMIGKEVRITKKPLGLKIFTYRALKDGNLTNALRPY